MKSLATQLVRPPAPDSATQRPVGLPIVQSTTFHMDAALEEAMARGDYRSQYLYTRMGNPTVRAVERRLAEVHGGEEAVLTSSGMAALSAALIGLTRAGDGVLADRRVYGVTAAFLTRYLRDMGREVAFARLDDPAEAEPALATLTRPTWVLGETISNPLCEVLDLAATASWAHARGLRVMIDNTFAGPPVCLPLAHGADLVVESLSKSIAGHSDVHGGVVVGAAAPLETVWQTMLHVGSCIDPHAAWLVWRGMQTLALRARASCENARTVAAFLRDHPEVLRVHDPGAFVPAPACLASPGSMLAFEVRGGDDAAQRVLHALRIVAAASSLGGVESLASLPFNTSHRTAEARAMVGLQPGTIRLSVGCEDAADLVEDLDQALRQR